MGWTQPNGVELETLNVTGVTLPIAKIDEPINSQMRSVKSTVNGFICADSCQPLNLRAFGRFAYKKRLHGLETNRGSTWDGATPASFINNNCDTTVFA